MVQIDDSGLTELIYKNYSCKRRQDAPSSYDMTTVAYVSSPNFVLNKNTIWDGKVATIIIPPERAIDIDTQIDLEFAQFLSQRKT